MAMFGYTEAHKVEQIDRSGEIVTAKLSEPFFRPAQQT
jgi:hypothetical protein